MSIHPVRVLAARLLGGLLILAAVTACSTAPTSSGAKAALEHAMRIPGVDQMVFISDGRPTDARSDIILKSVQAANARKGVKIYAVGLGDDQDKDFMEALATQNRGSYVRRSGLF